MSDFVSGAIRWWAHSIPHTVAIELDGDQLTYEELDAWVDRVASHLTADLEVDVGKRVGLVGGNTLEWVVTALAVLRTCGILTPLNHRLTAAELAGITADCEPIVVFAAGSHADRMQEASRLSNGYPVRRLEDVAKFRSGDRVSFEAPHVPPDGVAAILYTSGTTARPKGVIFSRQTLVLNLLEFSLMEPQVSHGMRVLLTLPLSAIPGITWAVIQTMLHGGTLFIEPDFKADRAIAEIERHQINLLVGVPFIFEAISMTDRFADADLSSLKVCLVGGARVSPAMLKVWLDKGVLLRQVYGLTEAGGPISVMPRDRAVNAPHLAGRGGMFTELRVVTPEGRVCDPGEVGEVHVRGPAVTPGYWNNPEATAETIEDHWLHTGDLAVADEWGHITIVDRLKDMIITGGINISPSEIENVLVELPAVEEVAVIGAPDAKFGETPAAIVRLRGEATIEELIEHCNTRLADFKVPRYIVLTDEPLPRMASGKLAKPTIREAYADIADTHPKVR